MLLTQTISKPSNHFMAVFFSFFFSKAGITRLASHHQLLQKGNQKSLIQRWIIFLFNPICCHTWEVCPNCKQSPPQGCTPTTGRLPQKCRWNSSPGSPAGEGFVTYKAQHGDKGYLGWSAADHGLETPSGTSGWDNASGPCSACSLQREKTAIYLFPNAHNYHFQWRQMLDFHSESPKLWHADFTSRGSSSSTNG